MRLMLAVLWILGCGDEPAAPESCETPECRQAEVLEAWERSPKEAKTVIEALPNPLERTAAIAVIISRYPDQVRKVCPLLRPGPALDRCIRAVSRKHLWKAPRASGRASGQIAEYLDLHPELSRRFASVAPDLADCQGSPDLISCLRGAAMSQARAENAEAAAAHCAAVPLDDDFPERWRSDCYFSVAEHLVTVAGERQYADAAGLCFAAEPFAPLCLKHLLEVMARVVPAADEDAPEGWKSARRVASTVGAYWDGTPMESLMVAGYWAVATGTSIRNTSALSGDLLEHIPPAALPHARAEAAAYLLAHNDPASRDLQGWVNALTAALAERRGLAPQGVRHPIYRVTTAEPSKQLGKKEGMKMTLYLGPAHRVLAEDPKVDMAICVLEAAALLEPAASALLEEGTKHADPQVRWTAEHLTAKVK